MNKAQGLLLNAVNIPFQFRGYLQFPCIILCSLWLHLHNIQAILNQNLTAVLDLVDRNQAWLKVRVMIMSVA
ncbi:hypothetical protein VB774_10805 [Pseudanabaena galeata UHCC 0370]|uniref:Transposase n=1 Tax=Pseudanabaena galeata UHCC 0370 TaxID=3110310 RepID=A0ABU5TIT4_9CYAN|nr:hypothetical protein [Pseudanabaena galeata]MEA5478110.1 hypothetical protein [Pseudanabaena galeata UHCC 0370]